MMETEKHYYFIKAIRFITEQNIKFTKALKLTYEFSKKEKKGKGNKRKEMSQSQQIFWLVQNLLASRALGWITVRTQ